MTMLLLGVLLAGATAAFVGLLIAYNLTGGPEYTVTMFGNHLVTVNQLGSFLTGIALTLLFGLGLAVIAAGVAHHRRRSLQLRHARREADVATSERDALAAQVSEHDSGTGSGTTDQGMVGASGGDGRAGHHRRRHLFGH